MSFLDLYEAVQSLDGKVSTKWLKDEAIRLSSITRVKELWTSVLDASYIRGFYIEGPLSPPVPLERSEALIVLARSLDRQHRRFVYTKELMHVFDTPAEKANTAEKFESQAERLCDPTSEPSPQTRAEAKAFWRALAVLCQEHRRLEYKRALDSGQQSIEVIATSLQIPAVYARNLFRDDFPQIVKHIKEP